MSEEEKEAIKEAKKLIEEEAHNLNDINVFMTDSTTLKILLNYIDKLQKELDNSISKDKIKDKIEELEELFDKNEKEITIQYQNQFIVDVVGVLEELLEDN